MLSPRCGQIKEIWSYRLQRRQAECIRGGCCKILAFSRVPHSSVFPTCDVSDKLGQGRRSKAHCHTLPDLKYRFIQHPLWCPLAVAFIPVQIIP